MTPVTKTTKVNNRRRMRLTILSLSILALPFLLPELPDRKTYDPICDSNAGKISLHSWGESAGSDIRSMVLDAKCATFDGIAINKGLTDQRFEIVLTAMDNWRSSVVQNPTIGSKNSAAFIRSLCDIDVLMPNFRENYNFRALLRASLASGVYHQTVFCIGPKATIRTQLAVIKNRYKKLKRFFYTPRDQFEIPKTRGGNSSF